MAVKTAAARIGHERGVLAGVLVVLVHSTERAIVGNGHLSERHWRSCKDAARRIPHAIPHAGEGLCQVTYPQADSNASGRSATGSICSAVEEQVTAGLAR